VLGAQESGGGSFAARLDAAFRAAGAVTLISAVFAGMWLVKSKPAEAPARKPPPRRGPDLPGRRRWAQSVVWMGRSCPVNMSISGRIGSPASVG
jgi:hypothetical protein